MTSIHENLLIRLATEDDAKNLIAIDSVVPNDPQRVLQIHTWCAQDICFLAETNEEIVGYGVLNYNFFGCGFIEMLMVAKHYRRYGAGHALLNSLKLKCQHPKLFTSTNRSNIPMQRLLMASGFIASGQIENLDENDPELVFFYSTAQA